MKTWVMGFILVSFVRFLRQTVLQNAKFESSASIFTTIKMLDTIINSAQYWWVIMNMRVYAGGRFSLGVFRQAWSKWEQGG